MAQTEKGEAMEILEAIYAWLCDQLVGHWLIYVINLGAVAVIGLLFGKRRFDRLDQRFNRQDRTLEAVLANSSGKTETDRASNLAQRIDNSEWDWTRFKRSDKAQEILAEMREQQERDGGPRLP